MDIIKIHKGILKWFENEKEKIQILETRLNALKTLQNTLKEKDFEKDIKVLEDEIKSLNSSEKLLYYNIQVIPLIQAYKKELNRPIKMNFLGKKIKPDTTERDKIATKILSIIRELGFDEYELENANIFDEKSDNYCEKCEKTTPDIIGKNMMVCSVCGVEKNIFYSSFSYNDIERINITSRYTYDRRIHFRDCINQFQGKQNSTIPDKVYEDIKELLHKHNLINENGGTKLQKYKKVTKKHIFMFLKECKYSKYYEDINLIYKNITDKPLPDISHLEEQLMKDFDILSELYDKEYVQNKKITRKNFINTQYVLYQLLNRHKFPCKKSDFNFLKTTERKQFHDTICSNLFNKLGWNHTSVF